MRLVMRGDGTETKPAEATKLSQFFRSSTAIFRKGTSLADTMDAVINYAEAIYPQYGAQFAKAQTKAIVEDTLLSDYLPTRIRSRYNDTCYLQKFSLRTRSGLIFCKPLRKTRDRKILSAGQPAFYAEEPQIVFVLVLHAHF